MWKETLCVYPINFSTENYGQMVPSGGTIPSVSTEQGKQPPPPQVPDLPMKEAVIFLGGSSLS